ncbi:hypothetical protein LINPERPRIM_LOCUS43937 [Linum perenne]
MAKGNRPRLLTTSLSERFLGSYSNHVHDTTADSSELGEEDVWSTVDNYDDHDDHMSNGNGTMDEYWGSSNMLSSRHGGLSLAFEDSDNTAAAGTRIVHQFRGAAGNKQPRQIASSAPMNVPDWGKILRINSVESMNDEMYGGSDDRESEEMVPPHEYLARGYSRSRKASGASVFEGVGRTLKGRDLRRVRDAVWSQTGFNG